jgi:CTP synthase
VGKYVELQDAYKSIYESLTHAGIANNCQVILKKIDSEHLEAQGTSALEGLKGILIPGGFGDRGIEGKLIAAAYARKNSIPFFGICLGLQILVIEFARHVAGMDEANSTEFNPQTPYPVIDMMEAQKSITCKGASMRLGAFECNLIADTHAQKAYASKKVTERHRHRFEFNNDFKEILLNHGLSIAGINQASGLAEIVEIKNHPWMVGVQFHPEFQSKPMKAHPLFKAFIEASLKTSSAHSAQTITASKPLLAGVS